MGKIVIVPAPFSVSEPSNYLNYTNHPVTLTPPVTTGGIVPPAMFGSVG